MSAQVYSVPGQTEGRRKAFLEWKSIDLSYELYLTCGGNVNYCKSVHHPIPTRENREHPISKEISKLSIECPGIFFSWSNSRGEEGLFWRVQEGGPQGEITPESTWLSLLFVKFEIILPFPCFLLDPLTNKHGRTWSSIINLWIYSRTYQK